MNQSIPFNTIENHTATVLASFCAKAEEDGTLHPEQLSIIYKNKWFKIFVPEVYGGLQMSLPDALKLEEDLARIDGSLGWTVTLCAGANLFVGYIDAGLSKTIFLDKYVCLGGSGAATGIAEITDNGYCINGQWKYATGAPHLTHFTANCVIQKNETPVLNEEGNPLITSFIFEKNEVEIIPDWNTMGLKATASHRFKINNLHVNANRAFVINNAHTVEKNPIYHYPFLQLAETTLAVNSLGMAEHFLDAVCRLKDTMQNFTTSKDSRLLYFSKKIKHFQTTLIQHKETFYSAVEKSWRLLISDNTIEVDLQENISYLSKELACVSRTLIADLYPLCGISATENNTEINRILRDAFTGSQHALLAK
ncbi:MAG: acyl-CoA dehydrogenase family protein [Niabella sp.]